MRPTSPSVTDALERAHLCTADNQCTVSTNIRPTDVLNYARIQRTPLVLAAVLALLAIGVLANLLVSSIRRRRHDIAILKTIGFRRRQVSAAVAWQATTVVGLALLVGLPVGVALGRWVWSTFATNLGIPVEPRTPVGILLRDDPGGARDREPHRGGAGTGREPAPARDRIAQRVTSERLSIGNRHAGHAVVALHAQRVQRHRHEVVLADGEHEIEHLLLVVARRRARRRSRR